MQGFSQAFYPTLRHKHIKAARAGEHGKGFAVVAAEVRKQAEQSHQATVQGLTSARQFKKVAQDLNELARRLMEVVRLYRL